MAARLLRAPQKVPTSVPVIHGHGRPPAPRLSAGFGPALSGRGSALVSISSMGEDCAPAYRPAAEQSLGERFCLAVFAVNRAKVESARELRQNVDSHPR